MGAGSEAEEEGRRGVAPLVNRAIDGYMLESLRTVSQGGA
jgi:hypothetical protein